MRGFLTMYVTKDYLLELIKEVEEDTGVKLTKGQLKLCVAKASRF